MIGLKIAKMCNGLPLAAIVYGNALRFKSSQEEWNAVLSSKLWELNQHMLSSLKRSYDQFSPSLKKCFN
ncbi:hypothetical protein DM860_015663 [Cuscuta australis]|uniref:Uncharacterized protein n=1 Tax=Cuscuta australis TaxID=267555 RepID=A0A328DJR8_9ASTE|nr:hypothetical protein DM860_015663 [Cuscuta australis]